jgi:small-conductance mechanosensitive channel
MMLQNWSNVLVTSFQDLWYGVISFLPKIVIALVIFIVGWVVGAFIGKLVEQLFKVLKVDVALRKAGVEDVLNRGGILLNSGRFVGALIKWFVIVVFLIAAFDVLGLTQVTFFLQQIVLGYLPNVIVAVLILLVAAVIAEAIQKIVSSSSRAAGIKYSNLLGNIAKWAIWIFATLAALFQLGIAAPFVQTLFTGAVVALSLAFGLSFGLGGQDAASRYIEKVRNEISDKKQM